MKLRTLFSGPSFSAAVLVMLAVSAGCSSSPSTDAAPADDDTADSRALAAVPSASSAPSCATGVGAFGVRCTAYYRTDLGPDFDPDKSDASDVSYRPSDLQAAYAIPSGGEGVTVAIIDAQDDPTAEADLAVYRKKFRLPECTTANGCFKKVDQNGGTHYPKPDTGWAGEISLDLDAVSAACPKCKILLVEAEEEEAASNTTVDPLAVAVDTAVKLGAKYISNSYSSTEATDEKKGITKSDAVSSASHYVHKGVAIFASSGDAGYAKSPNNSGDGKGAGFPADIPEVFAVGGTSLAKSASSRGWAEKVWGPGGQDGAGNSGCSTFFPKPSYQKDKGCAGRTITDLSAVADPATGLAVYSTYVAKGQPKGWQVVGGTSLASPLTAAIFAAAGVKATTPAELYANTGDFHDVTSGENGTCSTGDTSTTESVHVLNTSSSASSYLCHAQKGYDAPTGVGTPDGAKIGSL